MARKVMRTIRDAREDVSSELLSVEPILNEGYIGRTKDIDDYTNATDADAMLDKKDDESIKESEKKDTSNHPKGCSCGCGR